MYRKINAINNQWNRNYNFTDEAGYGFLMDEKLSLSFFGWQHSNGEIKFYKYEDGVFKDNFSVEPETVEYEFDPFDNVHFLRYPVEH